MRLSCAVDAPLTHSANPRERFDCAMSKLCETRNKWFNLNSYCEELRAAAVSSRGIKRYINSLYLFIFMVMCVRVYPRNWM